MTFRSMKTPFQCYAIHSLHPLIVTRSIASSCAAALCIFSLNDPKRLGCSCIQYHLGFSTVFAQRFERFQEANGFQMRSFSCISMDPSNFRFKIHKISTLGAKCYLGVVKSVPDMKIRIFCKVLPGRGQNVNFHAFSKGTDRGFSRIFVDFAFFNSF